MVFVFIFVCRALNLGVSATIQAVCVDALLDGSVTMEWNQISCTLKTKKGVRHLLKNISGKAMPGWIVKYLNNTVPRKFETHASALSSCCLIVVPYLLQHLDAVAVNTRRSVICA